MIRDQEIILSIGTHEITAYAVDLKEKPRVLSILSKKFPEGFKGGLVVNLEKASNSLENIVSELLKKSEGVLKIRQAQSVWVVLGNPKIKTYTFSSSEYFRHAPKSIASHDVQNVIDQTRSVATLPLSECVLQVVPVSFLVNDLDGIMDPLGLEAQRLGVTLKIFTMEFEGFKNISRAFELADIEVRGFYPRTLTSSEAVLNEQEKEEGALLIDVGYEATFFTHWKKKELVQSKVLNVGTSFLNQMISKEWDIERPDAEKVMQQYGALDIHTEFQEELIPLVLRESGQDVHIKRIEFHQKFLEEAQNWLEIILNAAKEFAGEEKLYHPHYVFTGAGVCYDNFLEFVQDKFAVHGRVAHARRLEAPQSIILNPAMASALGMANWLAYEQKGRAALTRQHGIFQKTLSSAKNWFSAYF